MNQQSDHREMLRYASVGMEFIAAFGLGVVAGMYLDRRRGGGTLWTLIGAALGFATGMYRIWRVATDYQRRMDRKDKP